MLLKLQICVETVHSNRVNIRHGYCEPLIINKLNKDLILYTFDVIKISTCLCLALFSLVVYLDAWDSIKNLEPQVNLTCKFST